MLVSAVLFDAKQSCPPFDLVFLDANKGGYIEYYDQVIGGGLLKQ